ncbi:hypothetical protein WA026_018519 [Henosepilachna vigintioctopunctata]|uniref:Chemosensory protein n=1 Tax=Henosepilachna vigintioctopunctata TaxID=420089 RepID=A0AAW1U4B1_9CUCU
MQLVIICVTLFCVSSVLSDDKYTSKFNNVDLKEIMKNERLLNAYFVCLTEGKGCTPEGEALKKVLPEAVQTGCAKCTDEHKQGAKTIASFLIKEKPEMWEKLVQLYDPDKTFRNKFKDQLKAEGFDV